MFDAPDLDTARRPRLLRAAALAGADGYRRARDLPRLAAGLAALAPGSAALLQRLRRIESGCELGRRGGEALYSVERHILALAALTAESRAADQAKASGSAALRAATKSRSASSAPGSIAGA